MTEQHNNKIKTPFSCVILAAGKGTRMKSNIPKVMHEIAGVPMVSHVVSSLAPLAPEHTIVVVSKNMDMVEEAVSAIDSTVSCVVQSEQLGTGHAVRMAEGVLSGYTGTVLVLYGDTPLITTHTLEKILEAGGSSDVVVLGMRVANPYGYGRLLVDNGNLKGIVEEKDADAEQKKINLCNSGVMAISGKYLFEMLAKITANNNAGEYYLTDIVGMAHTMNLCCSVVEADAQELAGVNSRQQLAEAEKVMQNRLREKMMADGVTLIDPDSVYLRTDTRIAADVIIHPQVVFGENVTVESNVEIRSFSHIEGAHVKSGAVVGPFARLRVGSHVGENAHVGNFVELKNTTLGDGAKANHLSYVGDSEVGRKANIGAGTITCNYDGVNKHKTVIGEGAFIGSNSSLVAPVSVGKGAVIGAGSVITQDVEKDTLAIERSPQVNKVGRVKHKAKNKVKK